MIHRMKNFSILLGLSAMIAGASSLEAATLFASLRGPRHGRIVYIIRLGYGRDDFGYRPVK